MTFAQHACACVSGLQQHSYLIFSFELPLRNYTDCVKAKALNPESIIYEVCTGAEYYRTESR